MSWMSVQERQRSRMTAFDEKKGYWGGSFFNRHFYVNGEDIANPSWKNKFDFIVCISVLEHIPDHQAAMAGMFKLLRPGGHVV